jgi:hypothetical protein
VQQFISKTVFVLEIVVFLATVVISLIYRRNKKLNPIRFFLLESVAGLIATAMAPHTKAGVLAFNTTYNLFTFLDLVVLYYYLWCLITRRLLRKILLVSFTIIAGICVYFFANPRFGLTSFMPILYGMQNLFITLPCLLYFYELFNSEDDVDLRTNPHFYIACAVLFFYGATFPFFMAFKTLYDATPEMIDLLSTVENLLIAIMDFTILRAFLCPFPEDHSLVSQRFIKN